MTKKIITETIPYDTNDEVIVLEDLLEILENSNIDPSQITISIQSDYDYGEGTYKYLNITRQREETDQEYEKRLALEEHKKKLSKEYRATEQARREVEERKQLARLKKKYEKGGDIAMAKKPMTKKPKGKGGKGC